MYEVFWAPSALEDLAALWVDAETTLRETITTTAAEIDDLVSGSPYDVGESRTGDRRIAFVAPLGLIFDVESANRRVVIIHVWLIRRQNN